MPSGDAEDWDTAVRSPSLAALQHLIASAACEPTVNKVQDAFVSACAADATEAMTLLLDWGTPPDAKDMSNRPALHAAAETGAARACTLLCKYGADLELPDAAGRTAITLCISRGHMGAVKALLHGGASVPEGASAPGLAATIKEVQAEKRIAELKVIAESTEAVSREELLEADPGAWRCQREHMRLLRLREEQRAGKHLDSFQERTAVELAAAERYRAKEAENHKFINQQKVEVLEKKNHIMHLIKELNALSVIQVKAKAEDDKLKAELQVRHSEIDELTAACPPHEESEQKYWASLAEAEQQLAVRQTELEEQKVVNVDVNGELQEAMRELEGWKRDRERAARLTAQAHKLLGN